MKFAWLGDHLHLGNCANLPTGIHRKAIEYQKTFFISVITHSVSQAPFCHEGSLAALFFIFLLCICDNEATSCRRGAFTALHSFQFIVVLKSSSFKIYIYVDFRKAYRVTWCTPPC